MDSFFTSLNKRQSMLLLTAVTFSGQESLGALEHLPEEEGALLRHRAQELLQIPREKRIPALVQEIKRLVKDRRGQLWSAEPERLAALLQRERGALMEVVLRALPGTLAEAVRAHLPPSRVKLTREVRPQVLDIVRWKLEELFAREVAGQQAAGFKFADVLQLQQRELLTMCDRLGARVLGPALAGLPDAEREAMLEQLPPDLKLLATKAVAANAPRKLPEEDARAQLEPHEGLTRPAVALRSAGAQRLARACVAQSPEFAARMLEKYRGEFGSLLAKWVREERVRPTARGDGGRTDIVMDLERLATRGLIERPVRLATPPPPRQSAVLPPPPGARKAAAAAAPPEAKAAAPAAKAAAPAAKAAAPAAKAAAPGGAAPAGAPAAGREVPTRPPVRGQAPGAARQGAGAPVRRDFMAERAARNAGVLSSREPSRVATPAKRQDGSAVQRMPARREPANAGGAGARREGEGPDTRPPRADPEGARIGPPPSRLGQRGARPRPQDPDTLSERDRARAAEGSRVHSRPPDERSRVAEGSRVQAGGQGERSRVHAGAQDERSRVAEGSRVHARPADERSRVAEGSRVHANVPDERSRVAEGSRVQSGAPDERSRVAEGSRVQARPADERSRVASRGQQRPAEEPPRAARMKFGAAEPDREDSEVSRVFRSRSSGAQGGGRAKPPEAEQEPERPPRVLVGRAITSPSLAPMPKPRGEGTSVQRRPRSPSGTDRPVPPGAGGRGTKGGTR
ncbi:hypothetical protein BHS09_11710 [Myxococcus xanthus]|uniref:Uncharacterized protein n=1 Tax=Myxococcus xanthus TaxID=34 RepID=A0AAE6FYK6_MYXXA|nr:hypothetical protein [Myxococcus xanthus]QDE67592.1 hypothetical protein BHS09_11710 [Myxococcus xanthus]QDE74869.1 hypothetical protein BHS08_11725 [Myxococcus xanthus]